MKDDVQKLIVAFMLGSSLGGVGGHQVGSSTPDCEAAIEHAVRHKVTEIEISKLKEKRKL